VALSWAFLLVAFAALCFLALTIAVMVMLFRAATRSSGHPSDAPRSGDDGQAFVPPVLGDDSLTNPANPLHHLHHPTATPDEPTRHHSADPGPSHSSFDSTPSSTSSFDSGGSSSSSFDSGSSPAGSDAGSNCG